MTKSDYELIAAALRKTHNLSTTSEARGAVIRAADTIAAALVRDNQRFDAVRFLEAAGVGVRD